MNATLPQIIQGGMGIGVSGWRLAQAVSRRGQLGVVSGTAVDTLMVRRLQDGDADGAVRRAMAHFPIPEVASEVQRRFFRPDGRAPGEPYRMLPMARVAVDVARQQVTMLANFVEVWLAKEGHDGPVGLNLLTKIQLPTLPSLFGAMLAGVDAVLMGAGIPKEIPGALDRMAAGQVASLRLDVAGGEAESVPFDPIAHGGTGTLSRPDFLPIVSSHSLATMLARKASGSVQGFIVEGPTAGGHNAPPRGTTQFNGRGEPIYGDRDRADWAAFRELGLPFWIAGGVGSPEGVQAALALGAAGVQVGTLFAFCDDSGLSDTNRQAVLRQARRPEGVEIFTDATASPTGFPFKVVQLAGTASEQAVYEARQRVCDLGYLRTAVRRESGRLDLLCPAEPVATFVKKGGDADGTVGRKCLCNALFADVGHAQTRPDGRDEPSLLTSGDDVRELGAFLGERTRYSAADVIAYLLPQR